MQHLKRYMSWLRPLLAVAFVCRACVAWCQPDVEPLVDVKFHEGYPFNSLIDGRLPAGSAAVAMAQAFTVWNHPSAPVGMVDYGNVAVDFSNEAPYGWDEICGAKALAGGEAARLVYHCAIASRTRFAGDWSMTDSLGAVASALVDHFGFDGDSISCVARDSVGMQRWNAMILAELRKGRPVIYEALDSRYDLRYTFVVDGYDGSTDRFHVNWGAGGTDNDWYPLSGLVMQSMNLQLSGSHCAILGLIPDPEFDPGERTEPVPEPEADLAANSMIEYARATGLFTVTTLPATSYRLIGPDGKELTSGVASGDGLFTFGRSAMPKGSCRLWLVAESGQEKILIITL